MFSVQQKKEALDKVSFYEHLSKITYNDRKNQNRYPYWIFSYVYGLYLNKFWITGKNIIMDVN